MNLTRFHRDIPVFNRTGSLRLCKSEILPICHGVFAPGLAFSGSQRRSGKKLPNRVQ
jgi:hypothetical protein